tara:strand:- start:190 stop:516 length:327 start_codon:yes stop_codon:yes gene_type:complete
LADFVEMLQTQEPHAKAIGRIWAGVVAFEDTDLLVTKVERHGKRGGGWMFGEKEGAETALGAPHGMNPSHDLLPEIATLGEVHGVGLQTALLGKLVGTDFHWNQRDPR